MGTRSLPLQSHVGAARCDRESRHRDGGLRLQWALAVIALIGTLLGGVLAVALGRLLARFAFQISALDLVTFVAAPLLLISATLLAMYVPARRATRVDPVRVLRTH